jgi:hypothetical protein
MSQDIEKQFLKLSKKSAQDKSERMNLIFRLIRIDQNQFLSYPEDKREDRICIEIDKGEVTKAVIQ